jgi:transcriptional regulator with XRE-family HTH domain
MPICVKLKKLRLERNWPQQIIAEKLHISQNAYSLIECGKTKIDEQRIYQLAKIFGVHPVELIKDDIESLNLAGNSKTGDIANMQALTVEDKELIIKLNTQLANKDGQIEMLMHLLDAPKKKK